MSCTTNFVHENIKYLAKCNYFANKKSKIIQNFAQIMVSSKLIFQLHIIIYKPRDVLHSSCDVPMRKQEMSVVVNIGMKIVLKFRNFVIFFYILFSSFCVVFLLFFSLNFLLINGKCGINGDKNSVIIQVSLPKRKLLHLVSLAFALQKLSFCVPKAKLLHGRHLIVFCVSSDNQSINLNSCLAYISASRKKSSRICDLWSEKV